MRGRQYDLLPHEVMSIDTVLATSAERTGYDLGRRLPLGKAVAVLDSLCRATRLEPARIQDICGNHSGERGVARLRTIIGYVDAGAESPQESETRLLLVAAGFPRPATQIPVFDETGRFVARLDMGWPEWKVAVEYDGSHHWTDKRQYAHDIDRHANLHSLGWTIIRATAPHLHTTSTP
ncbi:endonuclease domain-containing protein, partial [Nocardia sp. JMUB6875]|uniref:endonuclease domain-containing protein n=1 Tax=Nocardia sp. JMUB6875 TaxID=3158170 RepID=UPI0034E8FAEF